MSGQSGQSSNLEEQLRLSKELQAAHSRGGHIDLRGRGGRGGFRGSASGRVGGPAQSTPPIPASAAIFSLSQHTSLQGISKTYSRNGGFSPGAMTLKPSLSQNSAMITASYSPPGGNGSVVGNKLSPYLTKAQTISRSLSEVILRPTEVPTPTSLQDVTNQPKRVAPSSNIDGEFTKKARVQDVTNHRNQNTVTEGLAVVPSLRGSGVLSNGRLTDAAPIRHTQHARRASNSSDVDMTGVDSDGSKKPCHEVKKHGGMGDSIWAKPSASGMRVLLRSPSEPLEKRRIPARISDPTPTPAHLLSQVRSRDTEMTSVVAGTFAFVPRSQQVMVQPQSYGSVGISGGNRGILSDGTGHHGQRLNTTMQADLRRGGSKGGLGDSKWAT